MRTLSAAAAGTGIGAGLAYFLDPDLGKRRRHVARDRIVSLIVGRLRGAERAARSAQSRAYGTKQHLTHMREEPKPQPDDVTLARKVETEIFRDPSVPKGKINVNAEQGVIFLRGEGSTPEQIRDLVESAAEVQGVRAVDNRLHVAGPASDGGR